MTEPIGIILEGNTAPFVAGMTAAETAAVQFGSVVTEASAATRRAMIGMVTATDDEAKALASQKLAAASAMDALAAYGKEQTATATKAAVAAEAIRAQNASMASGLVGAVGGGGAAAKTAGIAAGATSAGAALKSMGMVGAIAIAGIGYESIKAASTFQQTTTRLQTQAGATSAELETMRKGVIALAGQTATAPNALASAIYEVASAGYKGADAVTVMKQAALGAKVGNADLTETTSSLVAAMKALNVPASAATSTMASLNAIVGAGKMTMDQLNAALGTGIIPTAQSFGVSLDSVGSALAYMTDRGTPADQAATKLRMTMSLLADPTAKAAKALGAIGLAGPDVKAATQDMADALAKANVTTSKMASDLRQSDGLQVALSDLKSHLETAGLSANAASAVLARAFGGGKSDAAILELIQNVDGLKQKFGQVTAGVSAFGQDVAQTQQTAAYQFAQLKASVDTLAISLGQRLLPVVTEIVGWMNKHIGVVETLAGVIGGVLVAATVAWTAALLANPVVLITAGIVALTTALIEAYEHSRTFRTIVMETWTALKTGAQPIIDGIRLAIDGIRMVVSEISGAFESGFGGALGAVRNFAGPIIAAIAPIVGAVHVLQSALNAIAGAFPSAAPSGYRAGTPLGDYYATDRPGTALNNLATTTRKAGLGVSSSTSRSPDFDVATTIATHTAAAVSSAATIAGLGDTGTGTYSPEGAGAKGKKTAAPGPYAGFQNLLKTFGSTEQTDFTKQAGISTQAQVTAAEKTDNALKTLAEAHLKHAQTLVKTATNAKSKAAATTLMVTAQGQVNAVTRQLIKVQNDGKTIAAAAAKAATELADARLEATSNMADQATADRVHITEAAEKLKADIKGTVTYYQDLTAYNQAVATGASDAATAAQQAKQDQIALQNAIVQAGINYADPLSSLRAAVTEAQNTLAGDTSGTTQWFLDTSALNQANQQLADAINQNTSATNVNTLAMTGVMPGGQVPGYIALRGANPGAFLSGPASRSGGGGGVTLNLTVNGAVGSPADIASSLAQPLIKAINGVLTFNPRAMLTPTG